MSEVEELAARLASVSHFKGLMPSDLRAIVTAGQVQRYQAGCYIFFEGDACAGMFVLLSGQVHLCKLGPQGQQHILAVIQPVIMFNEVAVLDGGVNPVTAIATKDSLVWRISYTAFQDLLQRYPQISLGLLRVMAARNRQLVSHYEDLSFRSVLARTAKLLLDLSDNGTKPINRRDHSIQEMAARVASVPEAVSRSLSYIKKLGFIELNRERVALTNVSAVANLAQVHEG